MLFVIIDFGWFLAYSENGKESGGVHSDVKQRYEAGDVEVRAAMATFAGFAEEGKQILLNLQTLRASESGSNEQQQAALIRAFGELVNKNFDLRLRIYGKDVIGERNLKLVEIGRNHGACCKFPGKRTSMHDGVLSS